MAYIFTRVNKLMIVLLAGSEGGAGFPLSLGIESFESGGAKVVHGSGGIMLLRAE